MKFLPFILFVSLRQRECSNTLQKLRLINGLLLPGGSADKSGAFFRTVRRLVLAAMRMNDRGDYFPIYAECLSFEMLAIFLSKVGRGERQAGRGRRGCSGETWRLS